MKHFVTGATGFLGTAVVRQLLDDGRSVNAIVRDPSKTRDLLAHGLQLFTGEVPDKESMRAGMKSSDGLFHIAGWYKIGALKGRDPAAKVKILGTLNVLELMEDLKVREGDCTSTLAEEGQARCRVYPREGYGCFAQGVCIRWPRKSLVAWLRKTSLEGCSAVCPWRWPASKSLNRFPAAIDLKRCA